MTKDEDPVISAQVLLKPSSGNVPRDAVLTAANIKAIVPAPEVVAGATRELASAGFVVGTVVGLSFSITARRSLFDSFFGITAAGVEKGEIPLKAIPARLRHRVVAITFSPPPDFGPSRFA